MLATFTASNGPVPGFNALAPARRRPRRRNLQVTATAASATAGYASCNLIAESSLHNALAQNITINFPGGGGVTVQGHTHH